MSVLIIRGTVQPFSFLSCLFGWCRAVLPFFRVAHNIRQVVWVVVTHIIDPPRRGTWRASFSSLLPPSQSPAPRGLVLHTIHLFCRELRDAGGSAADGYLILILALVNISGGLSPLSPLGFG